MLQKRMILLISIFISTTLLGQMPTDWGAFSQMMKGQPLAGKKFILEAAVRVDRIDSEAHAEIWVRVDRENKQMGFFYNMMDKPIKSNGWNTYTIKGKIDKDALYFVFGGLYHKKGLFHFDDFKLSIETSKDHFEPVEIKDPGFENNEWNKNWNFLQDRLGFNLSVSNKQPYAGTNSLLVDGSSFVKTPTIGNDDTRGQFAAVNNIKLYYEIYGEGPALLLLHGNSESIASFNKQIPELSKQFKVIAVDTRGQGKSTEDGKLFTYDLFAADMNALLDYLNLDSVNIIGWSDGGNTGLIMAMQYPKKVKRLITMGANVFIDNTVVKKWVFKLLHKELKEIGTDSIYDSQKRKRMIELLLTQPQHRFEELHTIQCPVLVIAGEKDIIKEAHTRAIAQHISHSTLLIAAKETHEYPRENPAAFNKAVLEYLNQH